MAERALYLCPYIPHVDSLRQLTESVRLGESRWDSLKNTPYSTPGRYITILDLRKIVFGTAQMDRSQARLIFYSCLTMLFPSLPNLKELYLPEGCGTLPRSVLEALEESPCRAEMRVLQNLEVTHRINARGIDPLVQLLSGMRELRSLKVCGLGAQDEGLDPGMMNKAQPVLVLPKLSKLHLSALRNGLLLATLKDSELPALVELQTNTYHLLINDLTHPFMIAHGHKISSLTIHSTIDWPPIRIPAHSDILSICPNLQQIAYLDHTCPPPPETFGSADWGNLSGPHPLKQLTVARWSTNANRSEITPEGLVDRLFQAIFRAVVVDAPMAAYDQANRRLSSPAPVLPWSSSSSTSPGSSFNSRIESLSISPSSSSSFPNHHPMTATILPDLEVIKFEDFTWLRPDLGPAALNAGVNGLLRKFSSRMAGARRNGPRVKVVDMHGNECPVIVLGGMKGGHQGGPRRDYRLGMKGFEGVRRGGVRGDPDDESG